MGGLFGFLVFGIYGLMEICMVGCLDFKFELLIDINEQF
jgi:hypothetical protein